MSASDAKAGPSIPGMGLSRTEFAAQFASAYRVLWLIAAGVTGDKSQADDVVQDAAMIALDKLDQFEPGSSFSAWMGQMVRFLALNETRKRRGRKTVVTDPGVIDQVRDLANVDAQGQSLGSDGGLPMEQEMFDDQIIRALSGVNEVARSCILLRTVEDLDYSEIAKMLDIPEGTAMSHVHRTRQVLRDRLSSLAPMAGTAGGQA